MTYCRNVETTHDSLQCRDVMGHFGSPCISCKHRKLYWLQIVLAFSSIGGHEHVFLFMLFFVFLSLRWLVATTSFGNTCIVLLRIAYCRCFPKACRHPEMHGCPTKLSLSPAFWVSQFWEGHAYARTNTCIYIILYVQLHVCIHNIHAYWYTHSLTDWLDTIPWPYLFLSYNTLRNFLPVSPNASAFQPGCTYQIPTIQSEYTYWIGRTVHQFLQLNHPKLGPAQCWWANPAMPTLPRWPTLFGEQGLKTYVLVRQD